MDPRIERMADVLVNYCVAVQPGQWVLIDTSLMGEEIAEACARSVLRAGGNPTVQFNSQRVQLALLREGNDEQLRFIAPTVMVASDQVDARISILAPSNTRALNSIDPARTAIVQKSREPLGETTMRRHEEGTLLWNIAQYPTNAAAQDAGMALEEYADFVFAACLLDQPDPVAAWERQMEGQQKLIDWISDKQTVHITGPDTDLTVGIAGRAWINDGGTVNFPGGEIFTGPIEDATEGVIQFTFPAYLGAREVTGVRLRFERGVVVEATATDGEDFLREMLNMDEGARRLGEFAFGTNYGIQSFTKNTLFDEKIGGTLHMALGRSYPETGGTNLSALHWDMVYDLRGAEVTVDGQVFSKNGEFQV